MNDRLHDLSEAGVSIWLDDISRERLRTGNLQHLIDDYQVVGVTSNPTIFAKAVSDADDYAAQVTDLTRRRVSVDEAVRAITTYDVRWGCEVMRPVFDRTGGENGRVSLEVDPRLAHDTDATIAEARALNWLVDRPNVMIKIPATKEGLPAIAACTAEGINVNVTLIFSLTRYQEVMAAFLDGLEQAKAAGIELSGIRSVASFFVSRIDTEADKRLAAAGGDQAAALQGKVAVANARLAYAAYQEVIASDRWATLRQAGANPQRPLWASTSTKNPAYPDTMYVDDLIAPDTVNTMPEQTMDAFADHGKLSRDSVTPYVDEARQVIDDLAKVGVSYDEIVQTVEDEGVEKFDASWRQLRDTVVEAMRSAGPAGGTGR
ncbi:MAG TPA: transaldolase [Nocardioidaceae bacterium]|nr:transaldolase [Nocardioidaceae bacterium]